ncbi:sigma-54-dependent transcriptional regulator [Desulfobaculum bizertense]|uniref:Two-component system, NtrC family, nitrogen regulation response regulator NtrX n=1 Tax=Desulfobaculum bizertense DSM 18034 TaxID=1121442 RepID=A0A1T4WH99_9BACT|nr:sigma-54 dependent transcriptional regulator [Desulfobaculum bizertense]UIJ39359.1 sigma-54 dependent transcriptional regulator [Desulfobaculum bizertense]SKA76670.1 two-component system, NtrC family, nitrogen regulation response regulator NtrX [Desulfobaculum bizertense DSM 18034]
MSNLVLVVDDEEGIRFSLRGILEDEGYDVIEAESGEEALALLETQTPSLMLLDIWLSGIDGLEVLDQSQIRIPDMPVVMISGHGNIETAVTAIKKGAFDFIEKPLSLEKVILSVNKACEFQSIQQENRALKERIESEQPHGLTGESSVISTLRRQIDQVAPTDAWVLITGENGTGKEIVARSIHQQSKRHNKPLVAVNCAAIPEELIESELFGHVKGAFTGADTAQAGKFELANKGTLFLDEIGDMSLKTQAKILRILQEQKFEQVGGRKTITVDVRVIAATNKDLPSEIKEGRFRQDLYYRLRVFPLEVPPLRTRSDDIPLLIDEFIANLTRKHGFRPMQFTDDAKAQLQRYPWPGNVRELKNFVERMLIMHGGNEVGPEDLPAEYLKATPDLSTGTEENGSVDMGIVDFKAARAEFEARFLQQKLEECNGNITRLAESIGLERSYLSRKLKSYGIQ